MLGVSMRDIALAIPLRRASAGMAASEACSGC